MQISTAYTSTALSFSQISGAAVSTSAPPPQPPALQDRVEVSDEAVESSRKLGQTGVDFEDTLQLVGDALRLLSSGEGAQATVEASYQEATIEAETASLSVGGTVRTKDGKELGFTLDLQYDHASLASGSAQLQAGPDGLSLSYAGLAAELTSTSFSFSITSAGDLGTAGGKGSFRLNDEISSIAKDVKPLAKEFAAATGMRGGWGQVNRLLRSVG